jgi:hypothetical protein
LLVTLPRRSCQFGSHQQLPSVPTPLSTVCYSDLCFCPPLRQLALICISLITGRLFVTLFTFTHLGLSFCELPVQAVYSFVLLSLALFICWSSYLLRYYLVLVFAISSSHKWPICSCCLYCPSMNRNSKLSYLNFITFWEPSPSFFFFFFLYLP